MNQINSGIITYTISVNIPDSSQYHNSKEKELYMKNIESNISPLRTIFFNGKKSKTEEINTDYGYKSLVTTIKDCSKNEYQYCKVFPNRNFCLKIKEEMSSSSEYFPPRVIFLNEYKKIMGYKCQKVLIEEASVLYHIWFTEEITVNDPTYAVLQHESIKGFVMEQETVFNTKKHYYNVKYTVSYLKSCELKQDIFNTPEGYEFYSSFEEVLKEK
ncbi:MAG: hypothetical protein JXK07_15400 [Spirochaetes bacterium]|nr:hypothetical protein [Spirochaetota bacterium]